MSKLDRPFDDYAFLDLHATGQIDLCALEDVETRYLLLVPDCDGYCRELDAANAAGAERDAASVEGATTSSTTTTTTTTSPPNNNGDWRHRIARWMLRASDELDMCRETAIVALSYSDRFLLGKRMNRHLFEVVAITCLLVSSKLLEKRPIKMAQLIVYTQGKFDSHHILSMEKELLASIGSFMYPPTASSFVLMFLNEFSCPALPAVLETCQFMIELAACDRFFLPHRQSNLAIAAIVVTMEQMHQKVPLGIKSAKNYTNDTEMVIKQLRSIYLHNEMRIKEIDGKENVTATNDRKRVRRAATPSPTPRESQEHEVDVDGVYGEMKTESQVESCKRDDYADEGRNKRQRCYM